MKKKEEKNKIKIHNIDFLEKKEKLLPLLYNNSSLFEFVKVPFGEIVFFIKIFQKLWLTYFLSLLEGGFVDNFWSYILLKACFQEKREIVKSEPENKNSQFVFGQESVREATAFEENFCFFEQFLGFFMMVNQLSLCLVHLCLQAQKPSVQIMFSEGVCNRIIIF